MAAFERALTVGEWGRLCAFVTELPTLPQVAVAEKHHANNTNEPDASGPMLFWVEVALGQR